MANPDQFTNKDRAQLLETEMMREELHDLQKPRKVGQKIGLGVIHKDLETLNKTITGSTPKAGRLELPSNFSMGGQKLDPKNKDEAALLAKVLAQNPELAAEFAPQAEPETVSPNQNPGTDRTDRLTRIGAAIGQRKQVQGRAESASNTNVFNRFVEQTKNRENLLADATEEQNRIFNQLEDTLIDLRDANKDDSEKLRKTLAELSGQLEATPNTGSKTAIGQQINLAREGSRGPNIGTALQALAGGKIGTAGKMLGQFASGKFNQWIENNRSPKMMGFIDRNFRTGSDRESELTGLIKALRSGQSSASPAWRKVLGSSTMSTAALANRGVAAEAGQPSISIENIDTLNVKAKNVNVEGGESSGMFDLPNPASPVRNSKSSAAPTKSTGKGGARARDAKGRFSKVTPKGTFGGKALKFGGRALGTLGLGWTAYSAFDENRQRGTGTAAAIAGGTAAGALGGAAAGASIGAFGGPLGALAGGLIGGALGAWGGQETSEGIADLLQPSPDIIPVPKNQGGLIMKDSNTNASLKSGSAAPIVVVPPAQPVNIANNNQSILLPKGNIRPTEHAFDRYVNRSTSYI